MINFFSKFKIIFYLTNFFLILLYLYPGSILGSIIYGDKNIQPQITPDFLISSNHFYVFILVSLIGFLSFTKQKNIRYLIFYLIFLSIFLEVFHLIIPARSFQWPDLLGNFFGVIFVIFVKKLVNDYKLFKK